MQKAPPGLPSLEVPFLLAIMALSCISTPSISFYHKLSRNDFFRAIQKREQPNVPAFAASIPSATYHILDVVGLP